MKIKILVKNQVFKKELFLTVEKKILKNINKKLKII